MKVVIVGAGAVGTHLSKLLSGEHQDCVLIDADSERLTGLSEYDVMTFQALPTSIKALKEAEVQHADLFVGVTPEESINMNACILAHALGANSSRHHQRSETLMGKTALGCARRSTDTIGHQTQRIGRDPEPSFA